MGNAFLGQIFMIGHVGKLFEQADKMLRRIAAQGWRGVPPGVIPQEYVPE